MINENTLDLIILFLVIAAIATILYLLFFRPRGYDSAHEDVVLDGRDEKNIIEAEAIQVQRSTGRELGGRVVLLNRDLEYDPPKSFEAKLSLDYLNGKSTVYKKDK